MADISQTNWSETDNSNSQAAPDGAPEGMAPSGVNNTMRAMMGATKRFWDRINGTVAVTNNADSLAYTPTVAAPSLADGEIYTFRANANNVGATVLNVGVGGTKALVKMDVTGTIPLVANDIVAGGYYQALWSSVDNQFVALNIPPATIAPASVSANIFAALHSVSACLTSEIGSLSLALDTRINGISNTISIIYQDIRSLSQTLSVRLASLSACLTANINVASSNAVAAIRSTSFVITSALGSGSVPAGSNMFFWNNAAPTGWTFVAADDYALVTQNVVGNGGGNGGGWVISGLSTESATHTHDVVGTTGTPSSVGTATLQGGGSNMATHIHYHAVSIASAGESASHTHTGDGTWRPKHLKVIMCIKN